MDAWTIAVLWAAWTIYWLAAARQAKPISSQEGWFGRLVHTIPYLLGFMLLALPRRTPYWPMHRLLPGSDERDDWALFAVAVGLGFTVWARRHLAGNWSNLVVLRRGHELITSGPYRLARHPIYSGILLAVIGTMVVRDDVRGLLGAALIAAVVVDQIAAEERLMEATFGEAYAAYRLAVPALLPRWRPAALMRRVP
ncbi:MAG: isoprenylcysteine carboxylmethyltransferase family protein [Rhodospirillales bacterium]|nr:isoprenylcysteine carboxylmethyltransferase family protein [Rhodospirillales bacterium]MDE2575634.1 isoprenylcysteine carboxylmethyltransferase family protein [Rhodospirillales bacterium]